MSDISKGSRRGGLFWVSLGLLVGLTLWRLAGPRLFPPATRGAVCPPATGRTSPRGPRGLPYGTLPGVDLAGLTDRQRFEVLRRAAAEPCTCGCKENIAECRLTDAECKTSLGLARALVRDARQKIHP